MAFSQFDTLPVIPDSPPHPLPSQPSKPNLKPPNDPNEPPKGLFYRIEFAKGFEEKEGIRRGHFVVPTDSTNVFPPDIQSLFSGVYGPSTLRTLPSFRPTLPGACEETRVGNPCR